MPSIVRGNTNAAVIAIAEKAADILLGDESAKAPGLGTRKRPHLTGQNLGDAVDATRLVKE